MWKKENLRKNFLRVKQIADQNLGRAEKSEVLSVDLLSVEKRVDQVRAVCTSTAKKLAISIQGSGTDIEKRLKKLPETGVGHTMIESATTLGTDSILGAVFQMCGECQNGQAKELLNYELEVENTVLNPMNLILENDIPTIMKLRKNLNKLTLDMDSARNRWTTAVRQSQMNSTNMAAASYKADIIRGEFEDASNKVDNAKDMLATEMLNFIAKENDHCEKLVALMTAQANYHKNALETIDRVIPKVKQLIDSNPAKPVYGVPLKEHLRVTERTVALVIEACVCTLLDAGLEEEGLFRIAGMASKVKKLKASFDAGIVDMEEYVNDLHTVAGALKQYLRELPEPLLTFELYKEFMQSMQLPQEQRLAALAASINKLPKVNYDNFRYLVKFLAKLASHSDVNKMTASNIAIVIGPNLLWSPGDSAPNMLTTGNFSAIIEVIINNADYFFPGEIDFSATFVESTEASSSSGGSVQEDVMSTSFAGSASVPAAVTAIVTPSITLAQSQLASANSTSHTLPAIGSSHTQPNFQVSYTPEFYKKSQNLSASCISVNLPTESDSSPKSQRKPVPAKKPAPPPPPERPHSVAVSPLTQSKMTTSMTWPRQAHTAGGQQTENTLSTTASGAPPPHPPPPAVVTSNGHGTLERDKSKVQSSPTERKASESKRPQPPERPKGPPPIAPGSGHHRSASTGSFGVPTSASQPPGTCVASSSEHPLLHADRQLGGPTNNAQPVPMNAVANSNRLAGSSSNLSTSAATSLASGSGGGREGVGTFSRLTSNRLSLRPTPPPPPPLPPQLNKTTENTHM